MSAYVIFDVEIRDPVRYQDFMMQVKPALEAAGGRYLARGGTHKVYEGDWVPRRIVLLEFPSVSAFESFYNGPIYQGLKAIRDECSSARLVSVEGVTGTAGGAAQGQGGGHVRGGVRRPAFEVADSGSIKDPEPVPTDPPQAEDG